MIPMIDKTYPRGTIFYFVGMEDFYILAQVGDYSFNLISLKDGNRKTSTWQSNTGPYSVSIPNSTWNNGGPPEVVFVPENRRGRSIEEMTQVMDAIKKISTDINLNKDLIEHINTLL